MDEALVDAWLYFPGFKVEQIWFLFFLFDYVLALFVNRDIPIERNTIIPEPWGLWLELLSFAVFVDSVSAHL